MAEEKDKGGRKPFEPTKQHRINVKTLSRLGFPERHICSCILDKKNKPIALNTLKKYFKEELAESPLSMYSNVVNAFYANCLKGNVEAQKFFLRTKGGWVEGGPTIFDDMMKALQSAEVEGLTREEILKAIAEAATLV